MQLSMMDKTTIAAIVPLAISPLDALVDHVSDVLKRHAPKKDNREEIPECSNAAAAD